MSSSPKLFQNPYFCSSKLNSRSFPSLLSQLSLALILLLLLFSAPANSSVYDEWFFNCNYFKCDPFVTKEFPFWRYNGTETCYRVDYSESMKLTCDGGRETIEIEGAEYQLLGHSKFDRTFIVAENGFSDRFCSPDKNISSSSMYLTISLYSDCWSEPVPIYTPTCSEAAYSYIPEESNVVLPIDMCWISVVAPIPQWLLKQVGDDFQKVAQYITAQFKSGRKVNVQVCNNCKDSGGGGVYVYDLELNQSRCCCQSSFDRIEFCSTSLLAATPRPSPSRSGMSNTSTEAPSPGKDENIAPYANIKKSKKPSKKTLTIALSVTGSIILIFVIIILFIYYTRKMRLTNSNKQDLIEETIKRYSTRIPKRYTYSTLKKITDSFKNKLGQGGFGTVYKGRLPDGRDVAVKLLNESEENCQDFINEVISMTTTSHVNIVTFLGFCYELNKRALIYEYMPKGSLDKYICHKGQQKNKIELSWMTLYNIIVGVARGLEYLHRGCNTRILHFDIKPHNILLDDEFCPKISDFGLSKQWKAKESHVSMSGAKGTIGFMAPEVVQRRYGKVSHKSDVYSYGMLILEMVGERQCPNKGVGDNSEEYFPDWIYKNLAEYEMSRNCKQWGETEEEEEIARKMVVVGLNCIQTLPDDRPSMTEVVAMMEGNVDGLPIPRNRPSSYILQLFLLLPQFRTLVDHKGEIFIFLKEGQSEYAL